MSRTLAPERALAHEGFTRFWLGQALAQLGFQFGGLALSVIAVNLLHATDAQMGYLNAANSAAFLLIGLAAGAWVDRWRKRRVMILADVVRAGLLLVVPVLWFAGVLEFWHLLGVGALVGVATVFFDVAYQSYIPVLVAREAISDANGKLESTAQMARLGGPAVAGALLKVVSAPVLLAINAGGYVVSAISLLLIRETERLADRTGRRSLLAEVREGLGFVFGQSFLRRLVASNMLSSFGGTIAFTLQPILVLRILGMDPALFGLIMSSGAVGGLVASVVAVRIARNMGEGPTIRNMLLLSNAGLLMVPLAAALPGAAVPILVAATPTMTFAVVVFNITQVSARQRISPLRLLGRMNASIRFLVWGLMPFSALAAGALGTLFGTVAAIWIGVLLACLGMVPFLGEYGRAHQYTA